MLTRLFVELKTAFLAHFDALRPALLAELTLAPATQPAAQPGAQSVAQPVAETDAAAAAVAAPERKLNTLKERSPTDLSNQSDDGPAGGGGGGCGGGDGGGGGGGAPSPKRPKLGHSSGSNSLAKGEANPSKQEMCGELTTTRIWRPWYGTPPPPEYGNRNLPQP